MEKEIEYSVIIPFYNEELSSEKLLKELTEVMDGLKEPYEVLAVNDGSTDSTRGILEKAHAENKNIFPIHFSSNKGQTASLAEGFRRASGRVVISMDGDLQDDPAEIPSMLEAFKRKKVDVLCGWRRSRKDAKRALLLSRTGNFFQKAFFDVPVHDISCTFRIYSREAAKSLKPEKEGLHRFLPFFLKRSGFSLSEKEVRQRFRRYGASKYSLKKAPETMILFFGILFRKY